MKNLIIIFVCLILGIKVSAQEYIVNLNMNPKVSSYIDEWKSGNVNAELQIINNSTEAIDINITTDLYFNDVLIATNNQELNNSIFLEEGLNFIGKEDFLGNLIFDEMIFSEKGNVSFNTTQRLPPGNYEICVNLKYTNSDELLPGVIPNNPACFPLIIMSYFPPTLIFPEDNSFVRSAEVSTTIFQWSPLVPICAEEVFYNVKVYEWFSDQTKEQAALVNIPLWEIKTTEIQTIFDFACLPWDETEAYVWQVQAMDENEIPLGTNNGYSEVWAMQSNRPIKKEEEEETIYSFYNMGESRNEPCVYQADAKGSCALIQVSGDCPNSRSHRIITTGGELSGFGRIGLGEGSDSGTNSNSFRAYSGRPSNVTLKYNYTVLIDCDSLPHLFNTALPLSTSNVERVNISTLLYENNDLIDISGTSNLNASMRYRIYENDMADNARWTDGDYFTIDSSMYKFVCIKESDDDDGKLACGVRIEVEISMNGLSDVCSDDYYIVTYVSSHGTDKHINVADYPPVVDYSQNEPSLDRMRQLKDNILAPTEANHIDINPMRTLQGWDCKEAMKTEIINKDVKLMSNID